MQIENLRLKKVLRNVLLVLLLNVAGMIKTIAQQPQQIKVSDINLSNIETIEERVFIVHSIIEKGYYCYTNINLPSTIDIYISSDASDELSDFGFFYDHLLYEQLNEFSSLDKTMRGELFVQWRQGIDNEVLRILYEDFTRGIASENATCETALPFTANGSFSFSAGVNSGSPCGDTYNAPCSDPYKCSGTPGQSSNCLSTAPNPAFYYIRITSPGDLNIYLESTPSVDIDFDCWGPFDDVTTACSQLSCSNIVDCSYSASHTENCHINNAQTGEYYILLITNYSNSPCEISFENIGTGSSGDILITTEAFPIEGGTVTGTGFYNTGETCTVSATANSGYIFVNWTENGTIVSTNANYTFSVTGNRTLVANFRLSYSITATSSPSEGGAVAGCGIYAQGTSCTLTAIPNTGYSFVCWTQDGSQVSTNPNYIFTVTEDASYVAVFSLNSYTVSVSANPSDGGLVSGAGTYTHGSSCTLTATTNLGYTFVRWTKNGNQVSTNPNYTFTVTEDASYVAVFSLNSYTVSASADPSNGGFVSGAGTYNHGSSCTLTATPSVGFSFVNWTESDTVVSTEPSISFTAYYDRTFVANFDMIIHHINVEANLSAAGSVSGGGDYQEGTYATVSAVPNTGFEFIHWTENGASVSANPNYMFAVWAPRNLVAEFEMQITDTVAYTCNTFDWHGHTYSSNGVYYDTLTSYLGIDSIVALHLTVYPSYHYEYTETECGNYFWEDSLYTESGDYTREFQSIYGCDSTLTLHLTILPIRSLGNFTYMSPANNYIDRYTDMDFYWDAIPNANCYDFYFWQGEGGKPNTPMAANITSHSYQVGGLTHGTTYHWCVVAKNECEENESATRTLTCELNPSMTVVPNGWYDFGEVEVGESRTRTISVSGTALTEDISYAYLDNAWGQDAGFFTITPSSWDPTSGGLLHVTFTPEATQLYYNAGIRIASGVFVDTLYFAGSLADRYVFTTDVEGEIYSSNDEITITGHVEDILGNAVSNMGVNVYLLVMGTRITLPAVSDSDGDYSVTYTPRYSESGYYQVGSCAYGTTSNDIHDAFDIPGMSRVSSDFIIWEPYQDETLTGAIEIRNRSRIPISNIQINTISLPDGCSVSFTGVTDLGPLETGQLYYTVTGTQVTSGNSYEEAQFQVTADNGLTMNMTCYYYCRQRRGTLDVYPPSIATSMKRYNQKALSFQITNNGNGETGPITISLPNVEWMSMMGGDTLESLPVGDSCAFSIMLAPDENVNLVQYTGSIAVNCANGNGVSIPYVIEATSDSTGVLRVDVTDDNTYNGNGDHLAGAYVQLKGYYSLEIVSEGETDGNGLFIVENVPEGYYYLTIHATEHKNYEAGIIYIEGGKTNHQNIYLQYQAISYSWVVIPTEIEDEYEFELVADIKTNVPVPVVTVDCPSKIDTLAYGDTIQFNLIVTNHGLIDAYETQLTMPTEFPEYDFIPMIDFIDTLHAKTSVLIPCIVTRTQRNRFDMGNYHCSIGKGRTVSGYWCNSKKEWVEFSFTLRFRVHCNYTGPDNPIVNFPPPSPPTPTPPDCPECIPTPPPSGPEHWPWPTDPTNGCDDIATTSQDCTPCWKVAASIVAHATEAFTGVPIGAFADFGLYWNENLSYYRGIVHNVKTNPTSLLTQVGPDAMALKDCITATATIPSHFAPSYGWRYNMYKAQLAFQEQASSLSSAASGLASIVSIISRLSECITFSIRDDSEMNVVMDQLEHSVNYYQSALNEMTNLFHDEEWLEEENFDNFVSNFQAVIDTSNYMISSQAAQHLKDVCELTKVNDSIIQRFVDRWNRSVQYWNEDIYIIADLPEGYNDDFIQLDSLMILPAIEANEVASAYGFESLSDMYNSALDDVYFAVQDHKNDVCAKISVSFKQTMTMTREAFEGTLKIFNGHTTDPMQDINVDIVIKDADGVDRTDLFQINVTSLSDVTGVDGTGTLDAQTEGIAQFLMIPTIEAAPDTTKIYYFGGSFSFLDPFSGSEMTYDLYPVQLKVNPGPNLHVDYFISRHIISDDPLTDTIEATEPAELAMMISNVGAGNANNVYLQSAQPQIIENQNGLLINFDIVAAAMNGVPRPLGLIDIPFGTIESHSAGIAEWYFTSTLMARVVHSTPHVIHNDSYGNPKLSLVTELNSHDLIKAIRAYGSLEDGINDFFVNETADFNHTPDKIYFSNGGTTDVSKIIEAETEGVLSHTNNVILLHVNPIKVGWNYACVDDPANGLRQILSCTRDDGQVIPLSNVWISHVTMFDEGAPVYENKLHIVDTLSTQEMTTYTLCYDLDLHCDIAVTINPEEGGTVAGGGVYVVGEIVTLEAISNEGYVFSNWTENGVVVSTEVTYSFTVEGDRNLVANFTLSTMLISLSDDFNDGVIDPELWTYTGNAVLEEDGLLKLQQNVTDQDVHLRSVNLQIPENGKVIMDRRFMVHYSYEYYYGRNTIRLNGDSNSFIQIDYTYTYYYDDSYHNDPKTGIYLITKLDGVISEVRLCDVNFDTWLTEHVEVDFIAGTLFYYMDTLVATVTIPGLAEQTVNYYNVEYGPYGWWTGHYHNMDYVNINMPSSDFYTIQATADPEEGGTVSLGEIYNFEDQQIPSNWTNDTVYPWVITTPEYVGYDGSFCMMSGNAGVHSSTSSIEVTVDFVEDGTISFLAGCWGEGTSYVWDKCIFSIDNVAQFTCGALQSWNSYSYGVSAGTHTFRWSYLKDGSVHPTGDAFFVDDVSFTGVVDGNPFYYGQTCTMVAIPNEGYNFVEWTKDGTQVSTDAIYTFTVTENGDYVAHFQILSSLSDDFNDGEINPDLWIATGNNVYEEEGVLKMDQNVTDQNVSLLSKPIHLTPDNKIVVERSFYVHKNNNYYYGGFAIEFNGETGIHGRPLHADSWNGSIADEWGIDYIGVVYGHTVYDGKYGIYVENGIGNTIQGTRLCDVAFDTWQTEKVVIDLTAGLLLYYLNGAFVGTVDLPELTTLAVNYYTTIFSPWGWFTGHQQYMDYINVNTDLDATYTITASANPAEGGTVSGGGTFQLGQTCTVTATANEDYTFMYWTVNGNIVSYDAELSFPVALDCDLVANFSLPLTVTAEADPMEGGTITGAGEFDYGTTCTLTAMANENYTFMYWTENGTQVSNTYEYSFTVTSDRNLVAHFSLPLTISALANLTAGGTVLGAGEYDYNTTCTLTATPNEGYLFLNWTKNGEVVSCNATYSFTVTEGADFEAVFMLLEGTLIGSGEQTNVYLPSYSYFNYTLSQQIYTSEEIGASGGITTISYFNAGEAKTRSYDIYMVLTDKSTFESNTDWITVSEADCVFSGEVTMTRGYWTPIVLDTPFAYDGTSNLAIIVDDNSGNWTEYPDMACRVFNTNGNQAIRVYSDNPNYDPYNLSEYNGTRCSEKNQVIFEILPLYHFVTSGTWGNASNWSCGILPGVNNEVFIDAPCQLDQDATVAALTVSEGQSLTLQSGKTLAVTNTLINTATTGLVIEDGAQLMHASDNVSATVKKNIAGHDTNIGKYRLISNPLASTINPELASVYHITKGNYDFYDWLASAPDHLEWRNFKDNSFMMSPEGCGYLYANQGGGELFFPGILKPSDNRYAKAVSYDSDDTEHPGWNLIGNPFVCEAYLVNANNEPLPFYRMNAAGDGFEAVTPGSAIAPMDGVFYQASGNGTVYFIRTQPQVFSGAINGKFTINDNGDQVYFSQGNLQYQASTNTWRFAEHQYDYIGSDNSNISSTYSGWIDLFGWGTSGYDHGANCYQPWSTSQTNSDYYAYGSYTYNLYDQTGQADWGYNPISNGGNTANQWRTLTQPEWNYVFNTRATTSGIRYAKANVNNVNGVILLPDDWSASTYSLSNTDNSDASYSSNTLTASQWNSLDHAGAVFLPAAGSRNGSSGSYGTYWSASYDSSTSACDVYFYDTYLYTYVSSSRYSGQSVRLVHPAEN